MVTVEQKLAVFSKLLEQDIMEKASEEINELEAKYQQLIAENKYAVDKAAEDIISSAKRTGETKKTEIVSKSKIKAKKDEMDLKAELLASFVEKLEAKVHEFTQTAGYIKYLEKNIAELESSDVNPDNVNIYITKYDFDNNKNKIIELLKGRGIEVKEDKFKIVTEKALGGLVIVDNVANTRIDLSIRSYLEASETAIMQKIANSVHKVGE